MYTENNDNYYYVENYDKPKRSKLGIFLKILIILICIGVLVWLIINLKKDNKNVSYDERFHISNIEKVRLAGEKYFFIDGNMPKDKEMKMVELATLIKNGLVSDVIDANNKVCNDLKSILTIQKDSENKRYILKIKLSCSTEEKEEEFYYDLDTGVCLNCNGTTLMDKKKDNPKKEDSDSKEETKEENNYSCNVWSEWSFKKENDSNLKERTRTVVLGVKKASTNTCEEWSDYSKTKVNNGSMTESKEEDEYNWVTKTSTSPVKASETIRNVSVRKTGGSVFSTCPAGYSSNGSGCVSNTPRKRDIGFSDYNNGKYDVIDGSCKSVDTEKGPDGKFYIVYKDCEYNDYQEEIVYVEEGYEEYTYEELVKTKTKYYRYCKKTKTNNNDEYTDEYYEEGKLPKGFVKVTGSEKQQYSYMLKVCEK